MAEGLTKKGWLISGALVFFGGCAGVSGPSDTAPFVGKTFSRMSVPLVGGNPGSVLLMVQKDGEIEGSLVMNVSLPAEGQASVLQISYQIHGRVTKSDGAFTATFDNKPYKIYGTLPTPPLQNGGNFIVEAGAGLYGPFKFGSVSLK